MTTPTTIRTTFARHRAAFRHFTPFGVLIALDMACLIRATARDAGCSVARVLQVMTETPNGFEA